MADGPNISGLVNDPDFQGLSPADKRATLGKVTGDSSFAGLNDGETLQFVSRFSRPSEAQQVSQLPDVMKQAAAYGKRTLTQAPDSLALQAQQSYEKKGGNVGVPGVSEGAGMTGAIADWMKDTGTDIGKGLKDVGTAYVSPGQGPGQGNTARGLRELISGGGKAMLPTAPFAIPGIVTAPGTTALTLGGGAAGGYGLKKGAQLLGANPEQQGLAQDVGGLIGGSLGSQLPGMVRGGRQFIQSLLEQSPERIAELQSMLPKEESIATAIANSEPQSRAAWHSYADNVLAIDNAPSNIASARNLARDAAEVAQKYGYRSSAPARSLANAPEPGVEDLAKNLPPVMQSDDPNVILQQLKDVDQMPFREVQRRSADIEQWISRNNPPAELYKSLKAVSNSLKASLEATANNEGKGAEYQIFKKMFQQHVEDFWDKNAPLRPWTGNNPRIEPDMAGKTTSEFLNNAKMNRVIDALERRGIGTQDIKNIIAKEARKPGSVMDDMKDAAMLRAVGRGPLDQRVADANKALLKKWGGRAGAAAVGSGGLGGIIKVLSERKGKP